MQGVDVGFQVLLYFSGAALSSIRETERRGQQVGMKSKTILVIKPRNTFHAIPKLLNQAHCFISSRVYISVSPLSEKLL